MLQMKLRVPLPVLLLTSAALMAQSSVTLTADRDNSLFEDPAGQLSNGAGSELFAGVTGQPGVRRALLHFNVATAIPAGSRIVSVTMQLYVSRSIAFSTWPVGAHRLLADWGEGTSVAPGQQGQGGQAMTNDATWLHRFYPATFWTTAGGDYAATASSSAMTTFSGFQNWGSTPAFVADVQSFLDQPAQNFGWLLRRDIEIAIGEVRRFNSREFATQARRPQLTITWLPPGAVMSVGTGCTGSSSQPLVLAGQGTVGPGFSLVLGSGQPGAVAVHAVGLGLGVQPLPVYPGCSVLLDPGLGIVTHSLLVLDGTGSGSTPFPVPTGFTGLEVDFQSLALDQALAAGFVLSNALRLVAP